MGGGGGWWLVPLVEPDAAAGGAANGRHAHVTGRYGGRGVQGGGRGGLGGWGAGRILRVKRSTEEGYEREGRSYKRVAAEVVPSEGQGVVLKGVEGWEVSLGYMPT